MVVMWGMFGLAIGIWVTCAFGLVALLAGYVYVADWLYRHALVRAFRAQLSSIPETTP